MEILKKNHVRVISESSVKNDLYVIDVKRVPGPSLNPQGVYWKGEMQLLQPIKENILTRLLTFNIVTRRRVMIGAVMLEVSH